MVPFNETEEVVDDGNLEHVLMSKETTFEIHKVLHTLDEPYREVFMLRTYGEPSFAQIAQRFGKTESWARVTFYRAKNKIKESLR